MSLFTTYGVQSSVLAKTVVAVISTQVEASTQNYNLTFVNNSVFDSFSGNIVNPNNWSRTDIIPILENSINTEINKSHNIFFWNNNTFLGYIGQDMGQTPIAPNNSVNVNIPNNATHFALARRSDQSTFNEFQSITVSYNTPATTPTTKTVTFFDEYPNGTQIGDVVNVTGPAIINPPATYKIRQLVFEE